MDDGKNKDPAWPDVLYTISAGSATDVEIEMFGYFDKPLTEGVYRLVRPFHRKLISLEFEI